MFVGKKNLRPSDDHCRRRDAVAIQRLRMDRVVVRPHFTDDRAHDGSNGAKRLAVRGAVGVAHAIPAVLEAGVTYELSAFIYNALEAGHARISYAPRTAWADHCAAFANPEKKHAWTWGKHRSAVIA